MPKVHREYSVPQFDESLLNYDPAMGKICERHSRIRASIGSLMSIFPNAKNTSSEIHEKIGIRERWYWDGVFIDFRVSNYVFVDYHVPESSNENQIVAEIEARIRGRGRFIS